MTTTERWALEEDLHLKMIIGGRRLEASEGRRIETEDPATGRIIGSFPAAGPWRTMTPAARGRVLVRAAGLRRRDAERLARIETL